MINYWAGIIAESQEDKTPYELYVSLFNTSKTNNEMMSEEEFNDMLSQMDATEKAEYMEELEKISNILPYSNLKKYEEPLKNILNVLPPSSGKKSTSTIQGDKVYVNFVETDFFEPLKDGNDNRGVKTFDDMESANEFIDNRIKKLGLDKSKFIEYKTDADVFPSKISQIDKNALMYQFKDLSYENLDKYYEIVNYMKSQDRDLSENKLKELRKKLNIKDEVFTYMIYTSNSPVPMNSWMDKLATGIMDANLTPEEREKLKRAKEKREEWVKKWKEQWKKEQDNSDVDLDVDDDDSVGGMDEYDDLEKTDGYKKEDDGFDDYGNMTTTIDDRRPSSNRRWRDFARDDDELDPNY